METPLAPFFVLEAGLINHENGIAKQEQTILPEATIKWIIHQVHHAATAVVSCSVHQGVLHCNNNTMR